MMKVSRILEQTRIFVRNPLNSKLMTNRKEFTNRKILASLRKLGVVSASELKALEFRVKKLEAELQRLRK